MQELWSSASYEPRLLSVPFALAPAAIAIVMAYTAVMRGAPVLRAYLLLHCVALLPYAVVMMLSPSITSPVVAEQLFRFAASFIPLAAAAGTGFQLALVRRYRPYRTAVIAAVLSSFAWIAVGFGSGGAVAGVVRMPGFWYATAGDWAWIALIHTVMMSLPGFLTLARVAVFSPPSRERDQWRAALVANIVTYSGLVDVALAYGVGAFPLGWLLSGIGCLLVLRALVVEDLLRVRAVDTSVPLAALHVVGAIMLAWIVLELMPADPPWWAVTIVIALVFAGVRVMVASAALMARGARTEGPLDRLLAQLVGRARSLTDDRAIARLAIDIIELGIGVRARVFLAATEDWGWTTDQGERLADERAPDPLVASWLVEYRAILFADDLDPAPPELRDLLAKLFVAHDAYAIVPVRSADEILAIVVFPAGKLRGGALAFVERAAERLAEAVAHARMARRAADRATLAREVELAATVQAELLPGKGPHVVGPLTVVGSWRPATRCAGDFWGFHPLGDGRALLAIGDVTGHGVASAMVTAACASALEVCVRRAATRLELPDVVSALDVAIRRVGGGQLAATCFAAIVDPANLKITYVSCGHPVPYLCRPTALHALVGRGNLLGTGVPTHPRQQERALEPGDLIVWYTDGVIEALDPAGKPFGDRRLQQLLKKLDRARSSPLAVHDIIQANLTAHRAGRALDDDETIVTARIAETAP